jgi:hypothetical protein
LTMCFQQQFTIRLVNSQMHEGQKSIFSSNHSVFVVQDRGYFKGLNPDELQQRLSSWVILYRKFSLWE